MSSAPIFHRRHSKKAAKDLAKKRKQRPLENAVLVKQARKQVVLSDNVWVVCAWRLLIAREWLAAQAPEPMPPLQVPKNACWNCGTKKLDSGRVCFIGFDWRACGVTSIQSQCIGYHSQTYMPEHNDPRENIHALTCLDCFHEIERVFSSKSQTDIFENQRFTAVVQDVLPLDMWKNASLIVSYL